MVTSSKRDFLQLVGLIAGLTPRKTTNVALAIATTQLHARKPRRNRLAPS